jgi:hypothetical protein
VGSRGTTFNKMQRDRDKKAKAQLKQERRGERRSESEDGAPELGGTLGADIPPDQLLALVATLHEQFESGTIDLTEFEERKAELFARITVD